MMMNARPFPIFILFYSMYGIYNEFQNLNIIHSLRGQLKEMSSTYIINQHKLMADGDNVCLSQTEMIKRFANIHNLQKMTLK